MKHFYFLLTTLMLLLLMSCKKDELKATVPAYLKIDEISVQINKPEEGSASSKISDAWVYVDDQLIGAFELPTVVPILKTGPVKISVRGGVFNNGLSNQRIVYPFYEFFTLNSTISPEQELEPDLVVGYKDLTKFNEDWSGEDFEQGVNFINNSRSDTNLVRTTDPGKIFEGSASGALFLPTGTTFAEVYSTNITNIPRNGTAVYMEMNYKATHDFAVSIYVENQLTQYSVINFRPTSEWNKVYIDFSKVFSTLFDASNYNIAIGMSKSSSENAELLIDNVKLMHF